MPSADVTNALSGGIRELGPQLLSIAEDQWFERKSGRVEPRRLAEAIVAFANADGGVIVVGLHSGTVDGTRSNIKHRNELMQTAMTFTEPTVRVKVALYACINSRDEPDDVLVFEVPPATTVHATTRDDVYLRVGDETRRLTFAQRRELIYDKGSASFETELSGLGRRALDDDLLGNYKNRVGAPDSLRLLTARGLMHEDELTMAGAILFARHPEQVLPNAHIRVSRFAGTSRGLGSRQQMIHDERIEGPVPRALLRARQSIRERQPTRRALSPGGSFEDIALVPEDAWLEGLVNAAVHRSYSHSGDHIHVDIFDDRIEIESPGRFPGLVDISDPIRTTRFARNPRIARVCADLRLGQDLGEGIRRIFEEMRLAGLVDPLYHQTAGSVQLTLSGEPMQRALEARLPGATQAIVAAMRQAGRLSTGEVATLLGIARPTAIRRLNELQTSGIVKWVGNSPSDPRAFWHLADR